MELRIRWPLGAARIYTGWVRSPGAMFLRLACSETVRGSVSSGLENRRLEHPAYFRIFTARATTRIPTTSETVSSAIIMSFAHGFIAETSVGLNAMEVL